MDSGLKIIFLDVDGVMNNPRTLERIGEPKGTKGGMLGMDPKLIAKIHEIIDRTKAKIVLSSTWRMGPWEEEMKQFGFRTEEIISVTGRDGDRIRGAEIDQWLESHKSLNIKKYAIIDDDSDMLKKQMRMFFQTKWNTGITDKIKEKVIKFLNED